MKLLLIVFLLASCAGYKFRKRENPFTQFGVNSLSVPMFYNHSNLHNVSGVFTQRIFSTMTEYKGLKLYEGNRPADATLIGIIESSQKRRDSVLPENYKSTKNTYGEDFFDDKREHFLLPSSNRIRLQIRIIVIKHPTPEEIKFLTSSFGRKGTSSKVIFNEVIKLTDVYNLQENEGAGIEVLGSQNRGVQRNSIEGLALKAASNF